MAQNEQRPIIIKKIDGGGGEHHGGAWKIAYADFVTAMMAFFLLMWLLNSTTEERRRGIAEFFNPMADKTVKMPTHQSLETEPSPLTGGRSLQMSDHDNKGDGPENEAQNKLDDRQGRNGGKGNDSVARIVPVGASVEATHAAGSDAYKEEARNIDNFVNNVRESLSNSNDMRPYKDNIDIKYYRDEIRIELKDSENTEMFNIGSAVPNQNGKKILSEISGWLVSMPEKVSIIGYTDHSPYHMGKGWSMSNWSLSVLRADHAREALVQSGYPDSQIMEVSGRADRDLALPDDPTAAGNRRIVIIMHRKYAPEGDDLPAGEGHEAVPGTR